MATTLLLEGGNSLFESLGVQGDTIAQGTELLQVHRVGRDNGRADLWHLEGQLLRVLLVGIATIVSGKTADHHEGSD